MVEGASRQGIESLSITEHVSQIENVRKSVDFKSTHSTGRVFRDIDQYLQEFSSLDQFSKNNSIRIKKGMEVDYIRGYEKEISENVNSFTWDIILRSVHELPNGEDVEGKYTARDEGSRKERWKTYIGTEIELVQTSNINFNVLTHPVRLAVGTTIPRQEVKEHLLDLANSCKSEQIAMELNGRDLSLYSPLVRLVAEACGETRCNVSFGSDAHHPHEIARGYEKAMQLVEEFKLELID